MMMSAAYSFSEYADAISDAPRYQKDKQERDQRHVEGVEFCQPRDDDGREAAPVGGRRGDGLILAGHDQEAAQAADRAGEDHRAHDDALDLDARIARGALALTDNGDLIAVLAVIEIDIHNAREDRHKQDREEVALPAETGSQPASVFWLMIPILPDPFGNLPYNGIECHKLGSYVVHHQCRQCLIGIPFCLEKCRNEAPDGSCCQAGHDHAQDHNCTRKLVPQADHAGRGCQTPDQDLSLTANIPEFHLESRCQADSDQQKNHCISDRHPCSSAGTDST